MNEIKLQNILGVSSEDIETLTQLNKEQKAYLKAIANMGGAKDYPSNEIEKLASATYGIKFNEKNLPISVLYPLEKAGYISLRRGTQEKGRGAKPFLVTSTSKLSSELIEPIIKQLERQTNDSLRALLRKSLKEILTEIRSKNKHIRGLALEALAFKLMRLIDLIYIATRLRGSATGGAEVDVIFESTRLVFSRWQIQCKNTARLNLDDVAKEVGLTHLLKSNVIVMVSTGQIGVEARKYANKIMSDSNLSIIMIDKSDIAEIERNPASIIDVFNRESKHAMQIKKLKIDI